MHPSIDRESIREYFMEYADEENISISVEGEKVEVELENTSLENISVGVLYSLGFNIDHVDEKSRIDNSKVILESKLDEIDCSFVKL